MLKAISSHLDSMIKPVRNEVRIAQEQALERIHKVVAQAEKEVDKDSRFLSPDQRLQKSMQELETAEQHLLAALGSMVKALRYIAPQFSLFSDFSPIKDIHGTVIKDDGGSLPKPKPSFFGKTNR